MTLFYSIIVLLVIKTSYYFFFKKFKSEKYKYIMDFVISLLILIVILSQPSKFLTTIWLENIYVQIGIIFIPILALLILRNKYLYLNKSFLSNINLIIIEVFLILWSGFMWSMINTLINDCWLCLPNDVISNSTR